MSVSSKTTIKQLIKVLKLAINKDTIKVPLSRLGLKEKNNSLDIYSQKSKMYPNNNYFGTKSDNTVKDQFNETNLNDEFIWMTGTTQDYNNKNIQDIKPIDKNDIELCYEKELDDELVCIQVTTADNKNRKI